MTGSNNGLMPGGMGLGLTSQDIVSAPATALDISSDLMPYPEKNRSVGNIYRGMYNPLAPLGRAPQVAASNFDLAFGDSIAAQQINNKRIWGGTGPVYNANDPAPFDVWHTAGVGDPPLRILERARYALSQNPDYFRGKNVFSPIGSNDTSQMDSIKDYLQLLKDNGVSNVVVPGLGPGVKNSAAANKALQGLVEGAGFTFFVPQVQWQGDGVHPNSQQMFQQASVELNKAMPKTDLGVAQPSGAPMPQPGQPVQANPLMPPPAPYTGPHPEIYNHALYYGVDPELALTTARIESDFGRSPDAPGSQYKGVFQLGNEEWRSMGGTDANRGDRATQINLGTALLSQRQQELADRLGRTPSNWEIYMAHQQGVSGVATMLENPNMNAAEAARLATGNSISLEEARKRVKGNGGDPDGTAGNFLRNWQAKYEHFKGQIGDTPAYAGVVRPRVGGRPYAAEGALAIPAPSGGELPEVGVGAKRDNVPLPFGGKGPERPKSPYETQGPDLEAGVDPVLRRAMLLGLIGQMMQGRKFTPVSYDPFEVQKAGRPESALTPYPYTVNVGALRGPEAMASPVQMQRLPAMRPISTKIEQIG